MSVIKWIHFSDLHFNKTNINTRLLRDSIRSFLTENQIKCDYAFFSGDLRNAPDHCFQKDSVKYLRELCEAVNVSPDHFFMVPGNHDVDREIEKRDQAVKRILDNHGSEKGYYNTDEGKIKESDLRDIKTGQKQYLEIIEEFYEGNPERIEKYKGTSHFLVETEDFNIIHLDSTLVYTKGQDESLVIGTDLLYDLLEKVDQHPELPYEDGARTIFLYTKGRKGRDNESLSQLLDYMENTTRENAVSEELEAIQEMVDVVKEDAEVTVAYMKGFERDQMFLEEGKELGRKLEQENTLREKNRADTEKNRADAEKNRAEEEKRRADAAVEEIEKLRRQLEELQKQ